MDSIYAKFDQYEISTKEKRLILDSIELDFDIKWGEGEIRDDLIISFSRNNKETYIKNDSLWGCHPPFANVKKIVSDFFGMKFDGSKTDALCMFIHSLKGMERINRELENNPKMMEIHQNSFRPILDTINLDRINLKKYGTDHSRIIIHSLECMENNLKMMGEKYFKQKNFRPILDRKNLLDFNTELVNTNASLILDSIELEFNIKWEEENGIISFSGENDQIRTFTYLSLWGCQPPFANIKTIVSDFFKMKFEGSKTEKLCNSILFLKNMEKEIVLDLDIKRSLEIEVFDNHILASKKIEENINRDLAQKRKLEQKI